MGHGTQRPQAQAQAHTPDAPLPPRGKQTPKRTRKGPGPKPRPITEFPIPSNAPWEDPPLFHEALDLHMRRHGDTAYGLRRALAAKGLRINTTTLRTWRVDLKAPSHRDSFAILRCLEERWRLPPGYFQSKLPQRSRAMKGHKLPGLTLAERRRLAWHLPDDFSRRPLREREEILDWVRRVIISGAADYRRYQAEALKRPFGIRFPELEERYAQEPSASYGPRRPTLTAPPGLAAEMAELLAFKTATLTRIGYERHGVWGNATAGQRLEHFGLLFGALAAPADGDLGGAGVPHADLSFALLVFPQVWDWYLRWRERRRGFYTRWETDMLANAAALSNPRTGWMTQTPALAERLRPLAELLTDDQVARAQKDWPDACAALHEFARVRMRELKRVTRVHHDPFEPILPVLEADSPIAEYLKIADEVLRLAPSRRYPRAAAESARAYLMIRLGLHLGFRQKNLRQLLVCRRKEAPTPERQLDQLRRGELRWSSRDNGWEVFVPLSAFKNASSSFFGKQPFRLILPDLGDLYAHLDQYIERHRHVLLGPATDPGTLFVKSVKISSAKASYNSATFYEAWRLIIQRYGVFNPYTGRGAIEGLLPHGPHSVRDVLATHVLKQTGSYEQASYAIQDTPEMVANHYGRFLPQDKAAIAAQVLNRVWEHR